MFSISPVRVKYPKSPLLIMCPQNFCDCILILCMWYLMSISFKKVAYSIRLSRSIFMFPHIFCLIRGEIFQHSLDIHHIAKYRLRNFPAFAQISHSNPALPIYLKFLILEKIFKLLYLLDISNSKSCTGDSIVLIVQSIFLQLLRNLKWRETVMSLDLIFFRLKLVKSSYIVSGMYYVEMIFINFQILYVCIL